MDELKHSIVSIYASLPDDLKRQILDEISGHGLEALLCFLERYLKP